MVEISIPSFTLAYSKSTSEEVVFILSLSVVTSLTDISPLIFDNEVLLESKLYVSIDPLVEEILITSAFPFF